MSASRLIILLAALVVVASAFGFIRGHDHGPVIPRGDWPARFPQPPPGFNFKNCHGHHHKTTKKRVPTTTTTIPTTSTITEAVTEQPQRDTTFWIRPPTTPNAPNPVDPSGNYKLGDPLLVTVAIVDPFKPDAPLDPLNAAGGSDDFGIKKVGVPKAPTAVIDPDA